MKEHICFIILVAFISTFTACSQTTPAGSKEPWTQAQLLPPAELAKTINDVTATQPYLYCIGPQAVIKGSIDIGPTNTRANLDALKAAVEKLPKDAPIVVYCGCCPYRSCPNVRPAFNMLNSMGFKNHKLLDLPQNIKVDWIDHGYPVME